jgi:uncharacterized membrane protein (Fun14 family)
MPGVGAGRALRFLLAGFAAGYADDRRAVRLKVLVLAVCVLAAAVLEVPWPW